MRHVPANASARGAFSLLELSIVLIILGMLLGAIISGESIMQAQKLRTIGAEAAQYTVAMAQFQQKYGYLAGDFPKATMVWGTADQSAISGNCAAPDTTPTYNPAGSIAAAVSNNATCNGDGNGNLNGPTNHETYRAWSQLVAAGLMHAPSSGTNYNGISNGTSSWATIGGNVPMSSANSAAGYAWMAGPNVVNNSISADTTYFDGDYSNALIFGSNSDTTKPGVGMGTPMLTPTDMRDLDTKSDDGNGSTGTIRSWKSTSALAPNCLTGTAYQLSQTAVSCTPIFLNNFKVQKQ